MASVYKCLISYIDGGKQYAANVLHFAGDDAAGLDEWVTALNLGNQILVTMGAQFCACLSTDCVLTGLTCERIHPTGGPAAFTAANFSGTGAGTMGSGSIGGQFKWIPTTATRKPGRMTLPSPPSAWIIQDKIITAYQIVMQTLGNLLQATFTDGIGNNWGLGIWSKKLAAIDRVAHWEPNLKIGVQRRRLLRTQ